MPVKLSPPSCRTGDLTYIATEKIYFHGISAKSNVITSPVLANSFRRFYIKMENNIHKYKKE